MLPRTLLFSCCCVSSRSGLLSLSPCGGKQVRFFGCHHPRKRMIQYSRAVVMEWRSCGVMDTPVLRVMTVVWLLRVIACRNFAATPYSFQATRNEGEMPRILMTGASGGIGTALR